MIEFHKYHAYGNAYTIVTLEELTAAQICALSDPVIALGGDGLLLPQQSPCAPNSFSVRIFNPDGSEAEKSGNGLSIFATYLHDQQQVATTPFQLKTTGGKVTVLALSCQDETKTAVSLLVGYPTIEPSPITLSIDDRHFTAYIVNIGNPHCVIFDQLSSSQLNHYAPLIEHHPAFPQRTNVQFVQVQDKKNIALQIWERGAGVTAASGSSASAVAAVCHALGYTERTVRLHMAGGTLPVSLDVQGGVTIHNTVQKIATGRVFL